MQFVAVLNREGGTLRTTDMNAFADEAKAVFARHGHTLDCRPVAAKAVERSLRAAATTSGVDAILAGGGDGTISAAAAIAHETGTALAVLPAGTMNLFARALGVPLELTAALEALAAGTPGKVDIATANGRPFVHQFGVGIHARLVRIRDGMNYGSRLGKILASVRAVSVAAVNPPRFEVELRTGQSQSRRKVSGIAISNNPLGERHIHAAHLDSGKLGVYLAAPVSTSELTRLTMDIFLGSWRDSPLVSEMEVPEVELHFPRRKKSAQAVIDGELVALPDTVTLKIIPKGLPVILPQIQ